MDVNADLIAALEIRLQKIGYYITLDKAHASLIINGILKIVCAVIEHPGSSPKIMQMQFSAIHDEFFPQGIIENLVSVGDTMEEKIESGLDNYFYTTLPSIIDSLFSQQGGELDYRDKAGTLWHSSVGNMGIQGQWESNIFEDPIFYLLKPLLIQMDLTNKFNWAKVYVVKHSDGSVTGECLLNNAPWEVGYRAVLEYASHWIVKGQFLGQKQFMVFRRCDAVH